MNNNHVQEEQKFYTRKEVAEKLGISESTVYRYANENLIRPLPNPYAMRKQTVYYCKEVDKLAAEIAAVEQESEEMTIPQLAKLLGTSRQHIDYFIKSHNLPINRMEIRGRVRISLPTNTVEAVRGLYRESLANSPKYKRHLYYNEEYQLVLFQLFVSVDGRYFRVGIQEEAWGFYDENGLFIYYEDKRSMDALKLKPAYSIHSEQKNKESNYLSFTLPKQESVTWPIFDYFLSAVGIDNISIRHKKGHIELSIKQCIIPLSTYPLPAELTLGTLLKYLSTGELVMNELELFVIGSHQKTAFMIHRKHLAALEEEAGERNLKNISELLNQILAERYNK